MRYSKINTEYATSVDVRKNSNQYNLTVHFDISKIKSLGIYKYLLQVTPDLLTASIVAENFLSTCISLQDSGSDWITWNIWVYDTNNDANLINNRCGIAFFLPCIED